MYKIITEQNATLKLLIGRKSFNIRKKPTFFLGDLVVKSTLLDNFKF